MERDVEAAIVACICGGTLEGLLLGMPVLGALVAWAVHLVRGKHAPRE